jgi:hypothetical protein
MHGSLRHMNYYNEIDPGAAVWLEAMGADLFQ